MEKKTYYAVMQLQDSLTTSDGRICKLPKGMIFIPVFEAPQKMAEYFPNGEYMELQLKKDSQND